MDKNINLLAPELKRKSYDKTQLICIKVILVLIFAMTIFLACFYFWTKFSEYRLKKIENEMVLFGPQYEQVKILETETELMQSELQILKNIKKEKNNWTAVLNCINDRLPEQMWITSLSIKDNEQTIIIKGLAPSLSPMGIFLWELNKLSCFADFSLEKAVEVNEGNISLTEFTLVGTLDKRK